MKRLATRLRSSFACVLAGWAVVMTATHARADVTLTPLVTTGQPATGIAGATHATLGYGSYRIAGSGLVAFAGRVRRDRDIADAAWVVRDGTIELAVPPKFSGTSATECEEVREGPFPLADGNLVVLCTVNILEKALFYGPPGDLVRQFGSLDPAPSNIDPPIVFWQIYDLTVREPGIVAFGASFDIPTINMPGAGEGVWIWSPDGLRFVLAEGSPAPGSVAQYINSVRVHDLNASGRVLTAGQRTGSSVVSEAWAGTSNEDITRIAADGATAPSFTKKLQISVNYPANRLSDTDEATFYDSDSLTVWTAADDEDVVPLAAANGVPFKVKRVEVTPGGKMAFDGAYQPSLERAIWVDGLWSGTASSLRLIARVGAPLRGMPDTTIFRSVQSLQLNERGQMVLKAEIEEDGVSSFRLLRYSPASGFEIVVVEDAVVDDHGTSRAITEYHNACDDAQRANDGCLDDDGRLIFAVHYSDGTEGLILTDPMPTGGTDVPVNVPEDPGLPDGGEAGSAGGASGAGATPEDSGTGNRGSGGRATTGGSANAEGGARPEDGDDRGTSQKDSGGCAVRTPGSERDWTWLGVVLVGLLVRVRRGGGRPRE